MKQGRTSFLQRFRQVDVITDPRITDVEEAVLVKILRRYARLICCRGTLFAPFQNFAVDGPISSVVAMERPSFNSPSRLAVALNDLRLFTLHLFSVISRGRANPFLPL